MNEKTYSLFEFEDQAQVSLFAPINDVVMGGVSQSSLLAAEDGTATFSGLVSLENNGGFASIRASLGCLDLSEFEGVSLRLLGDGKRYKLRLTNSAALDTVVYESAFNSPNQCWGEVKVSFTDFEPRWRGKLVKNALEIDPKRVMGLGLMISGKQAGDFSLRLNWIRAYG